MLWLQQVASVVGFFLLGQGVADKEWQTRRAMQETTRTAREMASSARKKRRPAGKASPPRGLREMHLNDD